MGGKEQNLESMKNDDKSKVIEKKWYYWWIIVENENGQGKECEKGKKQKKNTTGY